MSKKALLTEIKQIKARQDADYELLTEKVTSVAEGHRELRREVVEVLGQLTAKRLSFNLQPDNASPAVTAVLAAYKEYATAGGLPLSFLPCESRARHLRELADEVVSASDKGYLQPRGELEYTLITMCAHIIGWLELLPEDNYRSGESRDE